MGAAGAAGGCAHGRRAAASYEELHGPDGFPNNKSIPMD